jgi:tripartite-type tricarboxylate transporter receptor subunit TctC
VPGYDLRSWYGFLAPKGTPASIITVINRESIAVVNAPEMKARLASEGADSAAPNSPEQFRSFIDAEAARWGKIIKSLGLTNKKG